MTGLHWDKENEERGVVMVGGSIGCWWQGVYTGDWNKDTASMHFPELLGVGVAYWRDWCFYRARRSQVKRKQLKRCRLSRTGTDENMIWYDRRGMARQDAA